MTITRPRRTPLYAWWESTGKTPKDRRTVAWMARHFNCARSTVYGLLDGSKYPSLDLATRIQVATGGKVPATAWVRRAKRRAA